MKQTMLGESHGKGPPKLGAGWVVLVLGLGGPVLAEDHWFATESGCQVRMQCWQPPKGAVA